MSEYRSLAESDYKAVMAGLADMRDGIQQVEAGLQSTHGVVLRVLHASETLEARVEALEKLRDRLEALERRNPPPA